MASSPENAPSGDNNGTVESPPKPPESLPPPESQPPPASQSPPPSSTPASPPPSPPSDSSPPPSPPSDSSPPPSPPSDSSPPPPDSLATPPPSTTPALSPPPDSSTSPLPPTNSRSPPSISPPAPIFSPPPRRAGGSQTPPSAALSPPSPQSRSSAPSSSSDSNVDDAILAGIISGGVVIFALIIICLICLRRKKKSKYYTDHGLPPKGGGKYFNDSSKRNSPSKDHIVNLPPPPGIMGTPAGGWGAPSPPPMAHNSNEFNPGYSGQYPMPVQPPPSNMGGYGAKSQFSYEELAAAAGGFSQANLLGQGGFGFVHKGVLPNGKEVAVKSLKSGSGQGEREFQAEVEIISRVHHRHLVSLVGYCIAGDKRMLVYEFVPNKTLEFHLHGKGQPVMGWASRLRIAMGSAKGLAYLHEDCQPRIIHRDIKASNILLDFKFEAMVADFGLAKLTSDNFTHVSTRVMGTFGYLAPEYAASGKLTEKSDVFSFGVMLLELITGRRPVDPTNITMEDSLVDWARPLLSKALEDGDYCELVDPRLGDNYVAHEMARMIASAAACIRHSARRRPRMSQIVRALDGNSSLDDLDEGVKLGQSAPYNPNGSRDVYDTCAYNADIMKFRQMVMASDNSTEYGATSEYGLNPSSSSSDSKEMDITSHPKQKL